MLIVWPGKMNMESPDVLTDPSGLKLQVVSTPRVFVLLAAPPSTYWLQIGPGRQLDGIGSHGGGKFCVRWRKNGYPGAWTHAGDPTNPGETMFGAPQKKMPLKVEGRAEASTKVRV